MNTLDGRIIFGLADASLSAHSQGMHVYILRRSEGGSNTNIFVGNFYFGGGSAVTFDCTDVIASDGVVLIEDDFNVSGSSIESKIANKYSVQVRWTDGGANVTSTVWVAKVHDYGNGALDDGSCFFNPTSYKSAATILLQGFNNSGDSILLPHYPIHGNNCPFGLTFMVGDNVTSVPLLIAIDDYSSSTTVTASGNTFSYINNCGSLTNNGIVALSNGALYVTGGQSAIKVKSGNDTWIYVRYAAGDSNTFSADYPCAFAYVEGSINLDFDDDVDYGNVDTSDLLFCSKVIPSVGDYAYETAEGRYEIIKTGFSSDRYGYKAAIFDCCPKRYYLFWMDRYGSFQCQPFSDNAKYSETFERVEIKDYQDRRRYANIQVQGKWSLNSGWIEEKLYPYYESLYTSPIVFLYDVKNDKRFNVMVTGDYVEKTYRSEKRMINISMDLEENKRQSIIY